MTPVAGGFMESSPVEAQTLFMREMMQYLTEVLGCTHREAGWAMLRDPDLKRMLEKIRDATVEQIEAADDVWFAR